MKKNTHTINYHYYMYIFMLSIYILKKFFVHLPSHIAFKVEKIHTNCVVFEMDSCISQASSMGV